jgi:hypothetical protein
VIVVMVSGVLVMTGWCFDEWCFGDDLGDVLVMVSGILVMVMGGVLVIAVFR